MKVRIEGDSALLFDFQSRERLKIENILKFLVDSTEEMVDENGNTMYNKSGKPRVRRIKVPKFLYTDNGDHLVIKKGLLYGLMNHLSERVATFDIEEKEEISPFPVGYTPTNIQEGIELYPFQFLAVKKAIMVREGIIQCPTGSGKSFIASSIVKIITQSRLAKKPLIVVPSQALLENMIGALRKMGIEEDDIGVVYGAKKQFNKKITVAIISSIARGVESENEKMLNFLQTVDAIIGDEVQHLKADSWQLVYDTVSTRYRISLTATPFDNPTDEFKTYGDASVRAYCGRTIFNVPHSHLRDIGLNATIHVLMVTVDGDMANYKGIFRYIYDKFILKNKERNKKAVTCLNYIRELGLKSLTLVQRKEHAMGIMTSIADDKSLAVFGAKKGLIQSNSEIIETKIKYEEISEKVESDELNTIIASQVFDEGVDISGLNFVMNLGAGKSTITTLQRLGRVVRSKKHGRNIGFMIDFVDKSHVYLFAQSKKRIKLYEEVGAVIHYDEEKFWEVVNENASLVRSKIRV